MKRACHQEGPSAGKRAAVTVRLNVGGRCFDTSRETLSSCPLFEHCLAERGCQLAEDEDGRIFLDRDGDLFRILLQAIRTGARPPQATVAEMREPLLAECDFFQMDWLAQKIRGEVCSYDLRPADRMLRRLEEEARSDPKQFELLDVFGDEDMTPLPRDALGIPLLLAGKNKPELKGTYRDFETRLDVLSAGLVTDLREAEITGLVIAGGSVIGSLIDCAASDIDIFLVCRPDQAEEKLQRILKVVQQNQSRRLGNASRLLVLRSNSAVTLVRGEAVPPLQVILYTYGSVQQIILHFDLDSCCFALELDKQRVVTTPRGKRALRHGVNVADNGAHGSSSYTRRLERYAYRGFAIAVPGFAANQVARRILDASYVKVAKYDLLLRLEQKAHGTQVLNMRDRGETAKLRSDSQQKAHSVRGFERIVVLDMAKVSKVDLPHIKFCSAHNKLAASPAVCVMASGRGEYTLLMDTSSDDTDSDDGEGYSQTPLALVYRIWQKTFERDLQHETPQEDTEGMWRGGVVQRMGISMMVHRGSAYDMAAQVVSSKLSRDEAVPFVFDFINTVTPWVALAHVLDAARPPLMPQEDDETFFDKYGIARRLAFSPFAARPIVPGDWWTSVYS